MYMQKCLLIVFCFLICDIYSKPVKIYQTKEVHQGYDTAEMNTIIKQARYFKNLGYDYVEYCLQGPDLHKFSSINATGIIVNPSERNNTIQIFKDVKKVLNDNGLKVIPQLINTMSHRNDINVIYPEFSSIPPTKDMCLLTANSKDSINSNLKITIKNNLSSGSKNNIFVYLLWDESEDSANYPDWVKNDFIFTKTEPVKFCIVNSNPPVTEIKYKLFRSKNELAPSKSLGLFGFPNVKRNKMMYLVMVARSRYDAVIDSTYSELSTDFSKLVITVSGSTDKGDYQWVKLNYNDPITLSPYNNRTTYTVKKITTPDNYVNISGIPPFIAHMNNALQNNVFMKSSGITYSGNEYDELGCITRPVDYNHCTRGNLLSNKHSQQIFDYYLDCIHEAYKIGTPPVFENPDIIEIGHDELGYANQCLIYPPKGTNKSEFVAKEIAEIIRRIDAMFYPNKPLIKLNGDSFTPSDYGITYDMCGDPNTGNGGVLQILKDTYKLGDRIIVACWMYDMIDGTYEPGRNQIHDKLNIIKYLNNLGYKFVTYGGEESALLDGIIGYNKTFQCDFEWLRVGQKYSQNWFGYEHGIWQKWGDSLNKANQATYGQLAALSSYVMKYPYLVTAYTPYTKPSFSTQNICGINLKNIRDNLSWNENVNYTKPLVIEHIGNTNDETMVANFSNDFNDFVLKGNSSDYSVKDNPLFAFAESERDQTITVNLTSDSIVKKGIMLRDNLSENCNSIYYYCQNGITKIEMRTNGSPNVSSPMLLFTPPASNMAYLKVDILVNQIKLFFSIDGQNYKLLLNIPRSQMASPFLIGVANSNSTTADSLNYKIKWGKVADPHQF